MQSSQYCSQECGRACGVVNINNNCPKTLPWDISNTTSTNALSLPSKWTHGLLLLRSSDTMEKNCPPTLINLSLYNRLRWLILSNAGKKSNGTRLPSKRLSKATRRWWDNVSEASHVLRPLWYENWQGGSRLLSIKKYSTSQALSFQTQIIFS